MKEKEWTLNAAQVVATPKNVEAGKKLIIHIEGLSDFHQTSCHCGVRSGKH